MVARNVQRELRPVSGELRSTTTKSSLNEGDDVLNLLFVLFYGMITVFYVMIL